MSRNNKNESLWNELSAAKSALLSHFDMQMLKVKNIREPGVAEVYRDISMKINEFKVTSNDPEKALLAFVNHLSKIRNFELESIPRSIWRNSPNLHRKLQENAQPQPSEALTFAQHVTEMIFANSHQEKLREERHFRIIGQFASELSLTIENVKKCLPQMPEKHPKRVKLQDAQSALERIQEELLSNVSSITQMKMDMYGARAASIITGLQKVGFKVEKNGIIFPKLHGNQLAEFISNEFSGFAKGNSKCKNEVERLYYMVMMKYYCPEPSKAKSHDYSILLYVLKDTAKRVERDKSSPTEQKKMINIFIQHLAKASQPYQTLAGRCVPWVWQAYQKDQVSEKTMSALKEMSVFREFATTLQEIKSLRERHVDEINKDIIALSN